MPLPARTTTAWIHFPGIDAAIAPVRDLVASGATAVELMVAPALIVAAYNMVGAPEEWKELPPESAVLLVEFGAGSDAELDAYVARAGEILAAHETIRPIEFTRDAEEIELAWRVREGLHGLVGRVRPPGTALIVEDVCVPPERIAEGARDLQALLGEHGFLPGVAGHASAGNLHFMLTPDFAKQEDLERYESFMAKLVELIVGKYDGSLKAEHGTGINMAPYVEREWGEKATELMWRVKRLADPDGVLAPGVVLNRDPGVHLRNLKTTPEIEESATTCVECGFCEPVCPSRNLTTTPRQRIVLRREIARQPRGLAAARGAGAGVRVRRARHLRRRRLLPARLPARDRHRQAGQGAARGAALARGPKRWRCAARRAGAGSRRPRAPALRLGGPLARRTKRGAGLPGAGVRAKLPASASARAPAPSTSHPAPTASSAAADGPERGQKQTLARRRGLARRWSRSRRGPALPVWIPADVAGSCCGLPWSSKGYGDAHRHKANEMVERLWSWSGEGELPVVIDAASCTHAIAEPGEGVLSEENAERLARLTILDSVAWAHDRLLPQLADRPQGRLGHRPPDLRDPPARPRAAPARARRRPRRGGLRRPLGDLLRLRRRPRLLPPRADRGGDRRPGGGAVGRDFDAHLTSNRTCEIGLSRATGEPYESFVFLLERLTRSG